MGYTVCLLAHAGNTKVAPKEGEAPVEGEKEETPVRENNK